MVSMDVLLWLLVAMFALIGFLRGWAKELLVCVAAILSLFISMVLQTFVPFIRDNIIASHGMPSFWLRIGILAVLVFFGYQTPNISKLASNNRFVRDKLQDILLGTFLGAINGYLIWGSVWYYIIDVNYLSPLILPPADGTTAFAATQALIPFLPPVWLGVPTIYFVAALAFAFMIVVLV